MDSVAPLVKVMVAGRTLRSEATAWRARSTSRRAAWPARWTEEGLPQWSRRARVTASITSGRGGVVALLSRLITQAFYPPERHPRKDAPAR